MEALFPYAWLGGSAFYVFAVRTLLFSTAILFCLCVQWIPLSATPHDMLVRIFLSLTLTPTLTLTLTLTLALTLTRCASS